MFATQLRRTPCNHGSGTNIKVLRAFGVYVQRARNYSRRTFSNESDVVWAFLGILEDMKKDFPRGYNWALPMTGWMQLCFGKHAVPWVNAQSISMGVGSTVNFPYPRGVGLRRATTYGTNQVTARLYLV
jgi:hypothetical protein